MKEKYKLNDNDLSTVSGGKPDDDFVECGVFHTNCGGKLRNVGKPFKMVYCSKCSAENFLTKSFDYYNIYKHSIYDLYQTHHNGRFEDLQARPPELDWSCNQ